MPSLHVVTKETKAILKWGTIGIIILTVLIMASSTIRQILFPIREPAPTVSFNKVSAPIFPKDVTNKHLTYSVNTLDGKLPILVDQAFVYPIIQNQPNLLNVQNAEADIKAIGFINQDGTPLNEVQLSDKLYYWTKPGDLPKTMIMDIVSGNFNLNSPYASSAASAAITRMTDTQAQNTAQTFFSGMNAYPTDIDQSLTTTQDLMFRNNSLVPADIPGNTQIVRVDYFQSKLDRYSGDKTQGTIYYPNPPHSTMNALVAQFSYQPEVIEANYVHQTININVSSTYPLITTNEAFAKLQNGQGYVAAYFGNSTQIEIKNVDLAYYLGTATQQYLTPIYVFSNPDTGFYAYVSALPAEWIQ